MGPGRLIANPVCAALVAVSLGCGAEDESMRRAQAGDQTVRGGGALPPELMALRERACAYAAASEDSNPELIETVPTTERAALRTAFMAEQSEALPDRPIWLVQLRGSFTARGAPRPHDADAPRGRIMRFTVQRGHQSPGGTSWGLSNAEVDLSTLGPVTQLHDGATACSAQAPSEPQSTVVVPSDVRLNLRRQHRITISAANQEDRPGIAAERAVRVASDYGFGGVVSSAHLVRYSDLDDCEYDNEMDAGEPETARCMPLSMDRLSWLIVFRGARAPIFGPPGRRGPDSYDATIAAFVDARTGAEIGAVTLPPR